ncbi:amino acid transport protein [bacterium]|nr:amino acid transport protein [bacterium]
MNLLNTNFLLASLVWGSVGVGYFIYGKKQQEVVPLVGGLIMIAISYLVGSALLMSLISIGIMVAVYYIVRG